MLAGSGRIVPKSAPRRPIDVARRHMVARVMQFLREGALTASQIENAGSSCNVAAKYLEGFRVQAGRTIGQFNISIGLTAGHNHLSRSLQRFALHRIFRWSERLVPVDHGGSGETSATREFLALIVR